MKFDNIEPYEHQISIAKSAYEILKLFGFVYLAMEERTGKTLTSLLVVQKCNKNFIKKVLVVSKLKALPDWQYWLDYYKHVLGVHDSHPVEFKLVNFESLHKVDFLPDLMIIDEAHHCLSGYPTVGKTYKQLKRLGEIVPIICLSATPSAQSYSSLYQQLSISVYQPFYKYRNFYDWFREYGIPKTQHLGMKSVPVYTDTKVEMIKAVQDNYFISYSRKNLGFKREPEDVIHYIALGGDRLNTLKYARKNKVLPLKMLGFDKEDEILLESASKELSILHQLEGGTIKGPKQDYFLLVQPKIDYIKDQFGDTDRIAIFYHFVAEGLLLKQHFKHAKILQSVSHAEGIDLSHLDTCVIYSMNYSASKYLQRRARMCNLKRDKEIQVHYLLCKGLISEAVYQTVAVEKRNFTSSYYDKLNLF